MKILVIRFSSIGDLVLTTPVIRCLSDQLGAEVHLLTKKAFASVVKGNPNLSRVWMLDDNFKAIIAQVKKEKFDHVLDLHKNLRSQRVKLALARPSSSFRKLNFRKWVLVNFKKNIMPSVSIVDRYFAASKDLGIINDGKGLDFYIETAESDEAARITASFDGRPFVSIVLGAAHATKQIPEEKLRTFIDKCNCPAVLIGGPQEKELGDRLQTNGAINAAGKCSIGVSAALIQKSDMVITPDTGMMHIAAALRKPMISVWGNTVPSFGMYAYFGDEEVFDFRSEITNLPCRPCSKIGYDKCPKGHFKCMVEQDVGLWLKIVKDRILSA